jgi:hypothetical protein
VFAVDSDAKIRKNSVFGTLAPNGGRHKQFNDRFAICIQLTKCQVCGLVSGRKTTAGKLAAAPASNRVTEQQAARSKKQEAGRHRRCDVDCEGGRAANTPTHAALSTESRNNNNNQATWYHLVVLASCFALLAIAGFRSVRGHCVVAL